eukprot:TRINITY_DN883_c1_g1_i2.p1 TRINITY_DN883_c1_g1~~TRINITY_DN883_c1_g1_i2.p1  ORF type:complete len:196 (-),score=27.03 TRINITY_DN883_c1_g1_i2:382-969(-)
MKVLYFSCRPRINSILSTILPLQGGEYHGKVKFPPEYPHKPPSIYMITPSGRFQPNSRLCLSMSDFHPESWNPMWSVSSILTGLLSFMLEDKSTHGSVSSTTQEKRRFAKYSSDFNQKNPVFRKYFPDLLKSPLTPETNTSIQTSDDKSEDRTHPKQQQQQPQQQPKTKLTSDVNLIAFIVLFIIILVGFNKLLS